MMIKRLLLAGTLFVSMLGANAQFPVGLEGIHSSISNLSRGASSIGTWADGVLGTTEAIRVTENPSNTSFSGQLTNTDRQIQRQLFRHIEGLRSAGELNQQMGIIRAYRQLGDFEQQYTTQRSIAFVWRNNPTSSQYQAAVTAMQRLNNEILLRKITEARLAARGTALGLELTAEGIFQTPTQRSPASSARGGFRPPVRDGSGLPSLNENSQSRRQGVMSRVRSVWGRVRGAFGTLGRLLNRFRPRGGRGRLYESDIIVNSKIPVPNQPALISVYPNPAVDYINIKVSQELQNIQAQLYDLQGRMILNQPISGSQGVYSFSLIGLNLTKGTYILNIVHDGQLLGTEKMYIK